VDNARLSGAISTIEGVIGSMTGMLDELLDAARLRAEGALALNRAPVDLVALARETVSVAQETVERHHLSFQAGVPSLVGTFDGPRLQRVLANLLSNAVKYSPDETVVRVTVDRETGAEDDIAVLTVRDAGVGIPAADLPRIFEPFYRARNVANRIGGVGLGLAGSRQIVEQHGGTITAESREGEGSTFTVRLPLLSPTPTGASAGPTSPAGSPDEGEASQSGGST
jgi:signal transduction histidine kinase